MTKCTVYILRTDIEGEDVFVPTLAEARRAVKNWPRWSIFRAVVGAASVGELVCCIHQGGNYIVSEEPIR